MSVSRPVPSERDGEKGRKWVVRADVTFAIAL